MRVDNPNLPDDLDAAMALEPEHWGEGNHVHEQKRLRQCLFLRSFARYGIVAQGCRAANISRVSYNHWVGSDKWFAERAKVAKDIAADHIESEAFRRAVEGVDEPVIFQGEVSMVEDPETGEKRPLTVKKYSDPLMQLVLKGTRPEKYRENINLQADVKHSGVLVTPGTSLSPEEWAAQAASLQSQYAGNAGESSGDPEDN